MARTRAFLGRLGAAACSAKIVVLVLVGTAASLVASASAVHAASARPFNPDVGMYGDPLAAAPYWRQQHTSDCGEMAVADVVGQITGDEPAEQRITALAESTPSTVRRGPIWNLTADTDIRDLPVLLAHYRIKADNIQTSIDELEHHLAERHRVIVICQRRNHLEPARQPKRREPLCRRHGDRRQSKGSAPQRQWPPQWPG